MWSNFVCIETTLPSRAGLVVVKTTCLSFRTIGIELTDKAKERLLLVGEVGLCGASESEVESMKF